MEYEVLPLLLLTNYIFIIMDSKKINRDWRILVNWPKNAEHGRIRYLVGVSGLVRVVGVELATKLVSRAYASKSDVFTSSLRRGVSISFYNK